MLLYHLLFSQMILILGLVLTVILVVYLYYLVLLMSINDVLHPLLSLHIDCQWRKLRGEFTMRCFLMALNFPLISIFIFISTSLALLGLVMLVNTALSIWIRSWRLSSISKNQIPSVIYLPASSLLFFFHLWFYFSYSYIELLCNFFGI